MPNWGTEQDAVPLKDPNGTTGAAIGTSTSTRLSRSGWFWPTFSLRMYGLSEGGIQLVGGDFAVWSGEGEEGPFDYKTCSTYSTADSTNQWITFIDSASMTYFGGVLIDTDLSFVMAPADDVSVALIARTCVPGFKTATGWPYAHREYTAGSPCTFQTYEYNADFLVLYKDVCVVRMPSTGLVGPIIGGGGDGQSSAGYLMIAVRVRVLVEDLIANPPLTPPDAGKVYDPSNPMASVSWGGFGSAGKGLSDIVCWYADDPEFRTGVAGPFMLVHSTYALADTANARLWLGVPGAVWVRADGDRWLYVYYMCEPAADGDPEHTKDRNNYKIFEDALGCTGSAAEVFTGAPDEVDAPGQEILVDPAEVRPGIAVKRFRLSDIQAQVVDAAKAGSTIAEVDWTIYGGTGWSPVTGEALGYISVWFAGGSSIPAGEVESWDSVMPAFAGQPPRQADPMPLLCGRRLTLYFAAIHKGVFPFDTFTYIKASAWSGHGIWRCMAVPSGETLFDGTSSYPIGAYGVHFVASAATDTRDVLFESQVVHTKDDLAPYYDPDPVALPDRSVRVFFGQGGTVGTLQFVSGSLDDACFDDADLLDVEVAPAIFGSPPPNMPSGRARDAAWLREVTGNGGAGFVGPAAPSRRAPRHG